jgi:hypothetical protein
MVKYAEWADFIVDALPRHQIIRVGGKLVAAGKSANHRTLARFMWPMRLAH